LYSALQFSNKFFTNVTVNLIGSDGEEDTTTSTTTGAVSKLDVTTFYWVAGVCTGALLLVAALGVAIACACRNIRKREEKKMRVLRLDEKADYQNNQPSKTVTRYWCKKRR